MKIPVLFNIFFFVFNITFAQEPIPLPQPPSQVGGDAVPGFEQLEPEAPQAVPVEPTAPPNPAADPHLKKRNTWTPEGSKVTFGNPNGELVLRGYNKDEATSFAEILNPVCADCWKKQLHPWMWKDEVDSVLGDDLSAELIWLVSGSYKDLQSELEKDGGQHASFIWLGLDPAAKKRIVITLEPDGIGMIRIYQGEEMLVAQGRCSSGDRTKENDNGLIPQPNPGVYSMKSKATKLDEDGIKSVWSRAAQCWMKWALCLDPVRAIYVHAGSLLDPSAGCIHVSFGFAAQLFNRVPIGSSFEVIWVEAGQGGNLLNEEEKEGGISI